MGFDPVGAVSKLIRKEERRIPTEEEIERLKYLFSDRRYLDILPEDRADHATVKEAFKTLLKSGGLPTPKEIEWFSNPTQAFNRALMVAQMKGKARLSESFNDLLHNLEDDGIWERWLKTITAEFLEDFSRRAIKTEALYTELSRRCFDHDPTQPKAAYPVGDDTVEMNQPLIQTTPFRWAQKYVAASEALGEDPNETIQALTLFCSNIYGYSIFGDHAILLEQPAFIKMDDEHRLHADSGPAISWGKDFRHYIVHNVSIPSWVMEEPEKLTVQAIISENNAEIRRVMMDQFGPDKFVTDAGFVEVQKDRYGVLYKEPDLKAIIRLSVPVSESIQREVDQAVRGVLSKYAGRIYNFAFVRVKNSTPEPDGSIKEYFIPVPPRMTTAHEAVAWTFDETPETYDPMAES